jgi:hypothetical protein
LCLCLAVEILACDFRVLISAAGARPGFVLSHQIKRL